MPESDPGVQCPEVKDLQSPYEVINVKIRDAKAHINILVAYRYYANVHVACKDLGGEDPSNVHGNNVW